jgi:N-acetylneuraminate synthase|tara:strand:+ start:10902 stop:11726 length:825 start_codon:yes stop_codon:yes gene_type:complete
MTVKIIAEIGINHNGEMELTKKLIDAASLAGCDYVKFQKRTPDLCVPEAQKNKIRKTPWGEMKYIDYKHRIEFEKEQYDEIDRYCREKKIKWFASVWDLPSVDFCSQYPESIMKIPSALITDLELCKYARSKCDTLIISTGMSTEQEILSCVKECNPDVIMHTNSSYPSRVDELNLSYINHLKATHPEKEIGYSGHEYGLITTFATVAMGAKWIERHITLDRTMWGSDQLSSVEPSGLMKLVKGVRDIESSIGHDGPRQVIGSELDKRKSLRGT